MDVEQIVTRTRWHQGTKAVKWFTESTLHSMQSDSREEVLLACLKRCVPSGSICTVLAWT